MLLMASVLFIGSFQPTEASPDNQTDIEQVISLDSQDFQVADATDINQLHPTAFYLNTTAVYSGDIDHQLFSIQPPIRHFRYGYNAAFSYMPRSNLRDYQGRFI